MASWWKCAEHGLLDDDHIVELLENEHGDRLPIPVKACANCRRLVVPATVPL